MNSQADADCKHNQAITKAAKPMNDEIAKRTRSFLESGALDHEAVPEARAFKRDMEKNLERKLAEIEARDNLKWKQLACLREKEEFGIRQQYGVFTTKTLHGKRSTI